MASRTQVLERKEIEALIPHRPPFLFVERVLELDDEAIVTEWRVPEDAAFFEGHYPANPITPGVLLTEFAVQSAAVLVSAAEADARPAGSVPVLTRIQNARFRRMVRPGETVRAEAQLLERVGEARLVRARLLSAAGENVARLEFTVLLAREET
ncbi:MAG: beta-hydroxyacyl-ACP dehydratase [Planctomycetes bacterium]|nr:beta-hydroxyacyl-ACP dehydratase [Planctomycetota bacterium]MDP6409210.1 3-hydroxyacyl-ACP dehydratase FabZ family protein [Planctomycetota bacterium]